MLAKSNTIIGAIKAARYRPVEYKTRPNRSFLIEQIRSGVTLLVGEGNLSFSKSLVKNHSISPNLLVSSTFESTQNLDELTALNAQWLKSRGVSVLHGLNAKSLHGYFGTKKFKTILFQFPHTGKRKPVNGRNSNHILIKKFLKSARHQVLDNGSVIITHVRNPHYEGAFQFDVAAKLSGFHQRQYHPFFRSHFPSYEHRMTNEHSTAIVGYNKLVSSVFKPKVD